MATGTPTVEPQKADEEVSAFEGLDGDEGEVGKDEGGETKTEEELAAEAAEAEKLEQLKPIQKEDGTMETEAEAKARVEDAAAAAAEPTETERLREEAKDLRQMLRTFKREQVQMKAKIDRLEKRPVKAGEEGEEGEEGEAGKKVEEPLSRVEELQVGIAQIGQERGAALDILLETMEQGAYKDVKEVCSRGNFDDIFEAIATEVNKDTGKDLNEALLEVELNVWAKENPYKYMYDLIKKYHPSYVEKEKPAKPGEKKPTIVEAPGSIADKGGDGNIASGWTAKRIDDMPEDELDTVPVDVYDKYMRGELK